MRIDKIESLPMPNQNIKHKKQQNDDIIVNQQEAIPSLVSSFSQLQQ